MKNKKIVMYVFLFFLSTSQVFANVIWPALLSEEKISSIPIIGLSLLIEFFFFKWIFNVSSQKGLIFTLLANTVSGILGIFLRPLSGIIWELSLGWMVKYIFSWGTFNPVAWVSVPIFGGAVNAIIELFTIKIIGKEKITWKIYFLTLLINAVTIAIAVIWYNYANN